VVAVDAGRRVILVSLENQITCLRYSPFGLAPPEVSDGQKDGPVRLTLAAAALLTLSGCLLPLTVDPSKAAPWDLAALNRAIQDTEFRLPNQPVVVTGQVVSSYKGRHYELVLGLAAFGA
jgi:hypothetical protein